MIVNQQQIDTRKLPQVLGLRRLPHGFETLAGKAMAALDPQELLAAIDDLLEATRALLLTEQKKSNGKAVAYTEAFESGYPEFRKALQGILIACERRDIYQAKCGVMGVYRELNCMLARCLEGVEYSDFNSYADYEQNCISLGFPSLMPSVLANDFEHLYDRVLEFDRHLQKFLNENGVALNTFDSLEDLKSFLDAVRL